MPCLLPDGAKRTLQRVARAIGIALVIALILVIWILVVYVLGGDKPFEAHGTTPLTVIWLYLAVAVFSGIVVGLLQPLGRRAAGAALLGFLVALPCFLVMWLLRGRVDPWSAIDTITMLIWAAALGAPVGVIYRALFRSENE